VRQWPGPQPGLAAPQPGLTLAAAHGRTVSWRNVAGALKTTLTELGDSRVRVQVEVPPAEVEGRVERKARQLGSQLKLPGFRKGKVPAPLVIQRMGREAILEEAVRDTLSSWYADAIAASGIVPVGDPTLDIDMASLPPKGQALAFSIEIGVLPSAELGEYKGLEVGRAEPAVEEQRVEQEVEAMRERLARLETVERAAAEGDFVVIDYLGTLPGDDGEAVPFAGGEGRDQLIELGSGNLIPGFEEGLLGAAAGEERALSVTFPGDYPNEDLAGRDASFAVTVKEVKAKQLPELDDDFAVDAGFDDLAELRQDVHDRLLEAEQARVEAEFRQAALDAAVEQASVGVTPELIEARAREMWERMIHSLGHRGISREAYLQISGRPEEEILTEMRPEAEQALRREAVLTAVVAAEGISPEDEQVLEALAPTAEREGVEPQTLLEDLRGAGRLEDVREDLAAREAIDVIAAAAKPIPLAQAEAREKLWTPGKESETAAVPAEQAGGLWTPDR
jgi:trigger factor